MKKTQYLFCLVLFYFISAFRAEACIILPGNSQMIEQNGSMCTYSIVLTYNPNGNQDNSNGTLTFTTNTPEVTILTGEGPYVCACAGAYTLTFSAPCGTNVAFQGAYEAPGNGSDCTTDPVFILLPVEYMYINALPMANGGIMVTWATAIEVNNAGFFVERSCDGQSFNSLDFVYGFGTSSEDHYYEYLDEYCNMTFNNFYRLAQFDFDGKAHFSKIVLVSGHSGNGKFIESNLTYNNIQFSNTVDEAEVFNTRGERMTIQNNVNQLDMEAFPAGLYFIKIADETYKVIKM